MRREGSSMSGLGSGFVVGSVICLVATSKAVVTASSIVGGFWLVNIVLRVTR